MKQQGIDKRLVQTRDTSSRNQRGWTKNFWDFRKMFWDYLKKLNVTFYDACCPTAAEDEGAFPVRYNTLLERLEYFNGTEWVDIISIGETTSTSTTSSTTTTTTTAP